MQAAVTVALHNTQDRRKGSWYGGIHHELTQFYSAYRKHGGCVTERESLEEFFKSLCICCILSFFYYLQRVWRNISIAINVCRRRCSCIAMASVKDKYRWCSIWRCNKCCIHWRKSPFISISAFIYLLLQFSFLFRPVPVLTFIIVNKSINHRFYLEEGRGNYINPKPGTVVDTIVTRQERCVTFFCFLILLFAVMISS